jgi:formamidopyrimidine-DNA glycosylase
VPELPEVETARRLAEKHVKGQRIVGVYAARDPLVFAGVSSRKYAAVLKGRKVLAARRRGKHIWFELDGRPWLTFHFGMTGRFHIYREASERPRFCRLELVLGGGVRFAMTNKRRFGRVRLLDEPLAVPPISELGIDPLLDTLKGERVGKILSRRSAAIKVVLLDQRVFAGVGNWIADEVLYQGGIDPHRAACELSADEVNRICRVLGRIVRKAVAVDADKRRFPAGWLFHYRWGRNRQGATIGGRCIEFDTIGGRTTAWVPSRQS